MSRPHSSTILRPNSQTEVRKKGYKTDVDAEEARQWREDNSVGIRKSKREYNLIKKRREGLLNGNFPQQLHQVPLGLPAFRKSWKLFI
ncbi:hypothetical protein OROMI_009480 [Orobanche minor]